MDKKTQSSASPNDMVQQIQYGAKAAQVLGNNPSLDSNDKNFQHVHLWSVSKCQFTFLI